MRHPECANDALGAFCSEQSFELRRMAH